MADPDRGWAPEADRLNSSDAAAADAAAAESDPDPGVPTRLNGNAVMFWSAIHVSFLVVYKYWWYFCRLLNPMSAQPDVEFYCFRLARYSIYYKMLSILSIIVIAIMSDCRRNPCLHSRMWNSTVLPVVALFYEMFSISSVIVASMSKRSWNICASIHRQMLSPAKYIASDTLIMIESSEWRHADIRTEMQSLS